jgi:hypothetical protein
VSTQRGDAESSGLGDKVREFGLGGADGLGIFSGVIRARKPVLSGAEGPVTAARRDGEPLPVVASGVAANACEPGACC